MAVMRCDHLVCITALVAMLVLGAGPANGQAPGAALAPCAGVPAELHARCGSVTVPLDRANPGLGTTDIAFAVLGRRDVSRPSLGMLIGPYSGGPLIDAAPQLVGTFGPLLDRRELLIMDSRGGGRSDPILCDSLREVTFGLITPPERMTAAIGACGRELGPRVGAYGVAAVADDLDAVRAALGVDRLDLWGNSYASSVMTVYAARHPERVRSIVLSGAYPIAYDPFGLDKLAAARRALSLLCARTKSCSGRAVLRDVARVAARLRRNPVSFTARAGNRRFRLRLDDGALASVLWGGGDPLFLSRLPAAVRSARRGDLAPLRRLVETPALVDASVLADPSGTGGAAEGVFYAGACHDFPRVFSYADPPAARRAAFERALAAIGARRFAPFSPEGWLRAGFESPDWCLDWPNDPTAGLPLAPDAPLPDVPVLVLAGDLDTNTPTPGGREAASRYPRATFVEIPNAGHTPDAYSPCALSLARRFVRTLAANSRACRGKGEPPVVAGQAPIRAAQVPPVRAPATRADRRALGLLLATIADMQEQANVFGTWGSARGLRGGRYSLRHDGAVRLVDVRVVRDAHVSGVLTSDQEGTVSGTVRLAGAGTPDGRLRVRAAATGRGRAAGTLGGQRVRLRFQSR
jgi:pimeloyl-ACP methyl ester carboxylesterase